MTHKVKWLTALTGHIYNRISNTSCFVEILQHIIIIAGATTWTRLTGYCPTKWILMNPPWDPPDTTTLLPSALPSFITCNAAFYLSDNVAAVYDREYHWRGHHWFLEFQLFLANFLCHLYQSLDCHGSWLMQYGACHDKYCYRRTILYSPIKTTKPRLAINTTSSWNSQLNAECGPPDSNPCNTWRHSIAGITVRKNEQRQ